MKENIQEKTNLSTGQKLPKGSLANIMQLAIPVMMGSAMHTILTFIDRYFIAQLGIDQAAGSSLSGTLFWVLISFSALVSGGTTALVARKIGENNHKEVSQSAEQSILLSVIMGMGITAICYFLTDTLIGFYNVEPAVEEFGILYFKVILWGFPFLFGGMTIGAIFQAAGDTKTPMMVFALMNVINIVLDPLLIFGYGPIPGFGVAGAALATIIAEIIAFGIILVKLYNFQKVEVRNILLIKPHFGMIKRILNIGLWVGLNSFSRPITAVVLQKIIAFFGTGPIAAFSFGIQWISITFIFLNGLNVAIATLVGQNLGAGNTKEAEHSIKMGMIAGFIIIGVFIILFLFFAEYTISIFADDPDIIATGSNYIRIITIGLLFVIPMTVYTAGFNGAGDTMPPMIVSFISNWVFKIAFAAVTTYLLGLGVNFVWWAITFSLIAEGIGMPIWFARGRWKTKTI